MGSFIDDLQRFRESITGLSAEQYRDVYERMPRIQDETDNSVACLTAIAAAVVPGRVCDVGCGTGFLVNYLRQQRSLDGSTIYGVDLMIEPDTQRRHPSLACCVLCLVRIASVGQHAESDTVICTHVLEHILDIRAAITELRRVCAKKLVIVVPLEREYRFTFNPHIHFFPYPHSFLRHVIPVPAEHEYRVIGRDLLYVERRDAAAA